MSEPAQLLEWDSDFWGVRVARASGPVDAADEWARANAIDVLYALVDADDIAEAHAAEARAFRFVDVRVELWMRAEAREAVVRPATADDVPDLARIARTSHTITRFYADERFPRERADDLYETWIRRSCEGWADAVLVPPNGPDGYVTVHADRDAQRGSIGLIAVAEAARGRRLGSDLVAGAIDWCAREGMREVTVVTQGRNVAAQRLFQNGGFRTSSVGLWFHKWYAG